MIVFDVDEVLITTKDAFLRPEAEDIFLGRVKSAMNQAKTEEEKQEVERKLSVSISTCERFVIEPQTLELLNKLHSLNKKVIALTSHPTGPFGAIPSLERWKVDILNSYGFFFNKSFPNFENQSFTDLVKENTPPPLYLDGAIFSRGFTKGEVLLSFLGRLKDFKPSKVILIDDLVKNHKTVQKSLQERGISYEGYWYQKAAIPPDLINKDHINAQFDHLLETGIWK